MIGSLTHAKPLQKSDDPELYRLDRERLHRGGPARDTARLPDRRPGSQRLRRRLAALDHLRRRHERPPQADAGARARGGPRARDLPHPQPRRAADDARGRPRRRDRDHQRLRLPDGLLRRTWQQQPQPGAADRRRRRNRAGPARGGDAADGAEQASRVPRRRERRCHPQRPRGDGARAAAPRARPERGRLRRRGHRPPLHREPQALSDAAPAPSSAASSRRIRRSPTAFTRSRRQAASASTALPLLRRPQPSRRPAPPAMALQTAPSPTFASCKPWQGFAP